MTKIFKKTVVLALAMISIGKLIAVESDAAFQPMVAPQLLGEARKNTHWKNAFVTGKSEQIVFMNVSPLTNPKNEIGTEVHPFDQVILIVQGKGKAVLNGKESIVKEGDMIFIPEGTSHNVINLQDKSDLKLISFYSKNDIPSGAKYPKKADEFVD